MFFVYLQSSKPRILLFFEATTVFAVLNELNLKLPVLRRFKPIERKSWPNFIRSCEHLKLQNKKSLSNREIKLALDGTCECI